MAREIVLVVNPTAGRGRAAAARGPVIERLRAAGCVVREVSGADATQALALTRAEVAGGCDALAVLGGDGLVNLGLQVVAGTELPLGVLACGTGNDIASALGLPATDPIAAADVVAAGSVRSVDAVSTDAGWWVGVLGAGFDSAVNERANRMRWPRGPRRYDLAILAELRMFRPLPFRITLDGEVLATDAMLVAVGNTPSYGAGMRICPDAVVDDGWLDVCVVGPVSRSELIRVFPRVRKGTHAGHPAVAIYRAAQVRLEAPEVTAYADGERFAPLPLMCTCVPGALRVLAP